MKLALTILIAMPFLSAIHLNARTDKAIKDSITVYIFLHESCVISQHYTRPLKEMYHEFANENLQFVGVFPNFSSKPNKIEAFKATYNIPFTLKADYYHIKKELLGATVTPEVVVFNETKKEVLYKGRIDDTYARVGQKKRVTTTAELRDVLIAIANDQPIITMNTTAIGCFIGNDKLK